MSRNRVALRAFVIAVAINTGCGVLTHPSSTSFLNSFSLEGLVKANHSPSAVLCVKGGMGGGGGESISDGRQKSSFHKSDSYSCQVADSRFDQTAFMASIKADVEKGIESAGATIISRSDSDPAGFQIEYRAGAILGRIEITAKMSSFYYSLQATLDEKRE